MLDGSSANYLKRKRESESYPTAETRGESRGGVFVAMLYFFGVCVCAHIEHVTVEVQRRSVYVTLCVCAQQVSILHIQRPGHTRGRDGQKGRKSLSVRHSEAAAKFPFHCARCTAVCKDYRCSAICGHLDPCSTLSVLFQLSS
uniref:Uncharacterized protein n=1 Tax=Trypanosoma congolense (strain IL3000) TaxID=1068625 RepID=G0URX1_TRYCI|nr:hypothetical protein, unlikely [Trypanosoma congolense IL3000]